MSVAGLEACLKALREGDVLVVWKLDRLGRSLHHLVKTATMLSDSGIGLKVLTGQGRRDRHHNRSRPSVLGVIARFVRRITLRARNTSIPTSTHRLCDSVSRCPAYSELFGGLAG